MNVIPIQNKLFSGSVIPASFFWKNMAIEKRSSSSWIKKMYKDSIVKDFLTVLTSKIS